MSKTTTTQERQMDTNQPPVKYDDLVVSENGTRFYRIGRTIICIDNVETLTDRYESAEAAAFVLDMARER